MENNSSHMDEFGPQNGQFCNRMAEEIGWAPFCCSKFRKLEGLFDWFSRSNPAGHRDSVSHQNTNLSPQRRQTQECFLPRLSQSSSVKFGFCLL